jgi:hypothetical protein
VEYLARGVGLRTSEISAFSKWSIAEFLIILSKATLHKYM